MQIFTPLVEKCKSLGRAMRIGTNHGSLSARILSYYGDTPRYYQPRILPPMSPLGPSGRMSGHGCFSRLHFLVCNERESSALLSLFLYEADGQD